MRWGAPDSLWYLIPWALMPLAWFALERRARRRLEAFVSSALLNRVLTARAGRRRGLSFALLWCAVGMALVALARPQLGSREEELKSQGLDLVFALDVSNSMAAEDVVPSRLKKARHLIRSFLERMSSDRVGIVAFAGSAVPVAPLTSDYEYLRQLLETVDQSSISNQGTNIYSALSVSLGLIDRGAVNGEEADDGDRPPSRAIILISDGEDNEGEESKLAAKLKKAGIRVYSIGVGSLKGGPIPMRDGNGQLMGYKKDQAGGMVVTKLEMKALESVARSAGGKALVASVDEAEVDEILSDMLTLTRGEGASRKVIIYDEVYQYPLAAALALLIAMLTLSQRAAGAAAVFAFILAAAGSSEAHAARTWEEYQAAEKGVKAYGEGDFADAVNRFGKAQAETPDSTVNSFNLGTALLRSGSPQQAVPELEKSVGDADPVAAARGAYNLGRAFDGQSDHEKAMGAYQKGLERLEDLRAREGGKLSGEAAETHLRLKRALESAEQKQQSKSQQGEGQDKDKKGGDGSQGDNQDDKEGQQKDQKDGEGEDKKKPEEKKYKIPKEKQKFKAEHLSEQDAKRLMQQLKEQENQTQQKLRRQKGEEKRRENKAPAGPGKDW